MASSAWHGRIALPQVSIGGQAGPPDYFTDPREMPEPVILSATFTGPGEIAALMSAPCADVGRSCRLAGDDCLIDYNENFPRSTLNYREAHAGNVCVLTTGAALSGSAAGARHLQLSPEQH